MKSSPAISELDKIIVCTFLILVLICVVKSNRQDSKLSVNTVAPAINIFDDPIPE